jgi:hypothetical protein
MGNYHVNPPKRGQLCVLIDTPDTKDKIPANVYGTGSKVKVLGSRDLLCSRPDAPKVTCSLVQLPSGQTDVYFTKSLRPVN